MRLTRDVNETRDSKKFLGIEKYISRHENLRLMDCVTSLRSFNDSRYVKTPAGGLHALSRSTQTGR